MLGNPNETFESLRSARKARLAEFRPDEADGRTVPKGSLVTFSVPSGDVALLLDLESVVDGLFFLEDEETHMMSGDGRTLLLVRTLSAQSVHHISRTLSDVAARHGLSAIRWTYGPVEVALP